MFLTIDAQQDPSLATPDQAVTRSSDDGIPLQPIDRIQNEVMPSEIWTALANRQKQEAVAQSRRDREERQAWNDTCAEDFKRPIGKSAPLENHAIAVCSSEYFRVYNEAIEGDHSQKYAGKCACNAYRQSMPPLDNPENICDFVACVSYGLLLEAISGPDAARLLYAAQIAHAASQPNAPFRRGGRPAKHQNVIDKSREDDDSY